MTKKDFQIQIMFENLNVTMMEMGMCFSLHSFYQTRVRSLSCLVSKSLTESVTAFVETWLRWPLRVKIHATSFALPAIVSFDSPVVDIGTKQKTCCWCRNKKKTFCWGWFFTLPSSSSLQNIVRRKCFLQQNFYQTQQVKSLPCLVTESAALLNFA